MFLRSKLFALVTLTLLFTHILHSADAGVIQSGTLFHESDLNSTVLPNEEISFSVGAEFTTATFEGGPPSRIASVTANQQAVAGRYDASGNFDNGISIFTGARYEFTAGADERLVVNGTSIGSFGEQVFYGLEFRRDDGSWVLTRNGSNAAGINTSVDLTEGREYRLTLRGGSDVVGGVLESAGEWGWLWGFNALPGTTPDNPILPQVGQEEFNFENVPLPDFPVTQFYDPVVATGYEYVSTGPLFRSVLVPGTLPNGDSEFQLKVGGNLFDLTAGTEFDLTTIDANGVASFSILGIDTSEMLDPVNPTAFVTGLSFTESGLASFSMTPLTSDVNVVPEPSTFTIFGLAAIGLIRLRKRKMTSH